MTALACPDPCAAILADTRLAIADQLAALEGEQREFRAMVLAVQTGGLWLQPPGGELDCTLQISGVEASGADMAEAIAQWIKCVRRMHGATDDRRIA